MQQPSEEAAVAEKLTAEINEPFTLVLDKLRVWLASALEMVPNLVVALLVVVAFGLFARLTRSLVRRALLRVTNNPAVSRLLSTLASVTTVGVGVFIALGVLQLDKTVTSLLAGAGVLGLGLAFAFQATAANLLAGLMMSFQKPLSVGDVIETHSTFGTVERIDLRATALRTTTGQFVLIPNKDVYENPITNYSMSGERRVDLAVGVSYGESLPEVERITNEAISSLATRKQDRDVEIFFTGFGGSSIDLVCRFWIPFERQKDYYEAQHEAIMAVKKAYDENGVTIPFPIRTLDFGIKGGEKLDETLGPFLPSGERAESDA